MACVGEGSVGIGTHVSWCGECVNYGGDRCGGDEGQVRVNEATGVR